MYQKPNLPCCCEYGSYTRPPWSYHQLSCPRYGLDNEAFGVRYEFNGYDYSAIHKLYRCTECTLLTKYLKKVSLNGTDKLICFECYSEATKRGQSPQPIVILSQPKKRGWFGR